MAASAATVVFFDDFGSEADSHDGAFAKWNGAGGSIDVSGRDAETRSPVVGSFHGRIDFAGVVWKDREGGLRRFVTFGATVIAPEEQAATFLAAFGGDRKNPIVDDARLFEPLALRLVLSAPAAASLAAAPVPGSLFFLVSALIGFVALRRKR